VTAARYDPFDPGPFAVDARTGHIRDERRGANYPCTTWIPRGAAAGLPLVAFSHSSAAIGRTQSSFLTAHLAGHGYVVAALDHSELVLRGLQRPTGEETPEHRARRIQAWIDHRVPDIRLLVDFMLGELGLRPDASRIGIIGHSFGGWTALAAPESDARIAAVVALAPAGSSNPAPGIIPATLTFEWGRDVPTLYVVAENDTALPLAGMHELFERTRATKRMEILAGADHGHFFDEFDEKPDLCGKAQAHRFIRGLATAHVDAALKGIEAAREFWANRAGALPPDLRNESRIPSRAG
jgi:predicted dienelactone hydrolase